MTCRHGKDDPSCGSHPYNVAQRERAAVARELEKERADMAAKLAAPPPTPDASQYEIEEVEQLGDHLVAKVKYPNCAKCSYEGSKVMVFFNATMKDAIKWRTIDPHFSDPTKPRLKGHAPSPAARFPASPEGWTNAMAFAKSKAVSV